MTARSAVRTRTDRDRERAGGRVRVLIADDDPLARRTVRDALQEARGVVVVADTAGGREALELARYYRPTVALVDAALSGDAIAVTRTIAREVPETRVVVLAARPDDELALQALRAGAVAYVTKDVEPATLPQVACRVAAGEAVVPPALVRRVLEELHDVPDAGWRPVRSRLTTREWEIVDLLSTGATTDRIADRLVLSSATVYSHVKSVLRKLGVHSRVEAVAAAERLRREEAAEQMSL